MSEELNVIEKAQLIRKIAYVKNRIEKLENILAGEPLGTVRFANAVITSAKIANISASKITSGTIAVGEQILINDGVNNRILIDRDNFIISKPGVDVTTTITEANKKDFVLLNTTEAHKLIFAGIVEDTEYTHNLGYIPWYFVFEVDDATTPTYFKPVDNDPFSVRATTTKISGFPNPSYVMIYHRNH